MQQILKATDEISYLLENWWKLNMTWKEKVVTNAVKYLIENCKSSMVNIYLTDRYM